MLGSSVSCSVSRGSIHVRAPFQLKNLLKNIKGRTWNQSGKTWDYPATHNAATHIAAKLAQYNLHMDDGFIRLLDNVSILDENQPPPVCATPPWQHQKRAFWFAVKNFGGLNGAPLGGAMLALDMGTGKSKITLDLIQSYKMRRTLVVCPAKVVDVWRSEFGKHCAWRALRILHLGKGAIVDRAERLLKKDIDQSPLLVVTNYEATRNVRSYRALHVALQKIDWDLIVADECHRLKAPGGKDSFFFARLGRKTPCRLGLTGTPMSHGPMDIYAQMRFLDASVFGTSFVEYRSEYAIMGGFDGKQIIAYKNKEDLIEKLKPVMLQIRADDVLDLPEENHIYRPVELTPKTQEVYDALDKEFVLWVGEEAEINITNALTKLLKLQEVTGGFLRDPDTKQVFRIGTEKADHVTEILEDLPENEPVAIACRFSPDIEIVRNAVHKAKRTFSELSGRKNEMNEWVDGKTDVLCAQVQAGKEGIDLTRARYIILYSVGFHWGDYVQFLRRFRRPGQKASTVHYIHLQAADTVDVKIDRALARKENVIESILKEVRKKNGCTSARIGLDESSG